jgi:hypothetical protein
VKIWISVIILSFVAALSLSSEEAPWLELEKGKQAFRERDYGNALSLFRDAASKKDPYPEAEYWIGKVFATEGEWKIAERQYLKAIDRREALEVPDDAYAIKYDLAEVYRLSEQRKLMEDMYLQILADRAGPEKRSEVQLGALTRVLGNDGIDRAIFLFRFTDPLTLRANEELGFFYYQSGRTLDATERYAVAVNSIFSIALATLMERNPEFEYKTASAALVALYADREIAAYCDSVGLYKQLYYLAASLYFDGKRASGRQIWAIVKARKEAGEWGRRSAAQLANPTREFMNY